MHSWGGRRRWYLKNTSAELCRAKSELLVEDEYHQCIAEHGTSSIWVPNTIHRMSTIHLSCILRTLGWEYISRFVRPSTSLYVTLRGGRRLGSFSITSLCLVIVNCAKNRISH